MVRNGMAARQGRVSRDTWSVNGRKMGIPLIQQLRVGGYLLKQRLARRERYPLVLMLEPLFQCNLACAGCGKIDRINSLF